jgi:hypothetical protein
MTHRREGFGAAQGERAHIDLGLIPEFDSARAQRLGRAHRMLCWRFDGQERGDRAAQIPLAEGGREQGQHGKAELRTEVLDRRYHGRSARAEH